MADLRPSAALRGRELPPLPGLSHGPGRFRGGVFDPENGADGDRAAEAPDLLVAFAGKLATALFEEKAVSAATDEEKGKGGSSR